MLHLLALIDLSSFGFIWRHPISAGKVPTRSTIALSWPGPGFFSSMSRWVCCYYLRLCCYTNLAPWAGLGQSVSCFVVLKLLYGLITKTQGFIF